MEIKMFGKEKDEGKYVENFTNLEKSLNPPFDRIESFSANCQCHKIGIDNKEKKNMNIFYTQSLCLIKVGYCSRKYYYVHFHYFFLYIFILWLIEQGQTRRELNSTDKNFIRVEKYCRASQSLVDVEKLFTLSRNVCNWYSTLDFHMITESSQFSHFGRRNSQSHLLKTVEFRHVIFS